MLSLVLAGVAGHGTRQLNSYDCLFGSSQVHELRMEINSPNREKKVDAVKKVIANMTVGKDVSSLFTDVINCIQVGQQAGNYSGPCNFFSSFPF